jgi:voltage-gated potassium channel
MTTSNDLSAMSRRERWHTIIFEADTAEGRAFDALLLIAIGASVVAVCLESIADVRAVWGAELRTFEWIVTILFSVEYIVRLAVVRKPLRYAGSFYGVVDLLAVLPTYLSLFLGPLQPLLLVRAIRLMRVFRIFKVLQMVSESRMLLQALKASRAKLTVFLGSVLTLVLLIGTVMYLVEGDNHGFTSIPQACYWSVVTMTTVGYGDVVPQTGLGKLLASLVMVMGYALIAVPTGIVTVELSRRTSANTQSCPDCGRDGHDDAAVFCMYCGAGL